MVACTPTQGLEVSVSFQRSAVAAGVALVFSGCATIGTLQTAETNGEGQFQGAIEPGVLGAAGSEGFGGFGYFNLSGRYGVSDRVDIGGRFGTAGLEFTTKFMLTDPAAEKGPILSLAPSIGGFFLGIGGSSAGIANIQVPLIIGLPLGEHQFVLSPKVHTIIAAAGGQGETGVAFIGSLGSGIGFAAKVGGNVRIMPEFSFIAPLIAGAGVAGGEGSIVSGFADGALLQFSLGILVGGRQKEQHVSRDGWGEPR